MGWYSRSSRFIFDAVGRHHSKAPAFRTSSSRISNTHQNSPFVDGAKRFYSVDRGRIEHLITPTRLNKSWGDRPKMSAFKMLTMVGVGGLVVVVGVGMVASEVLINQEFGKSDFSMETVPFTNRRHFVSSISQEKEIAESTIKKFKSEYKEKIVAPDHPLSVRAQKIGDDIVEVVKSKNPHLSELEWEFVVMDEHDGRGCVNPGGKIFINSSLLNRDQEDDEVAAFIAHKVGHAVARHYMECTGNLIHFRKRLLLLIFVFIFAPFCGAKEALRMYSLPGNRRRELEADYIGLILMASAGYDPRVAPRLWEETIGGQSASRPFRKKRAQLLLQDEVMDKALSIYREARVQRGLEA